MSSLLRINMKFWLLVAVSLISLMSISRVDAAAKEVYILAVVPQFTASEVHRNWAPFVEKLSKASQRNFEIRIYPSIP